MTSYGLQVVDFVACFPAHGDDLALEVVVVSCFLLKLFLPLSLGKDV
jgi:hypothetical protein